MGVPIPDFPRRIQRHHVHPSSRNHDNDGVFSTLTVLIGGGIRSSGQACNGGDSLFLGWEDGVAALYSYQQPICIYYAKHGVVLMDEQRYSTTTARHQGSCWRAVWDSLGLDRVFLASIPEVSTVDFSTSTVDDLMYHLSVQYNEVWTKCARSRAQEMQRYYARKANHAQKSMHTLSRLVDGKVPVPDLPAPESFFTKKRYTTLLSEYLVNGTVPPWQITETNQ